MITKLTIKLNSSYVYYSIYVLFGSFFVTFCFGSFKFNNMNIKKIMIINSSLKATNDVLIGEKDRPPQQNQKKKQ